MSDEELEKYTTLDDWKYASRAFYLTTYQIDKYSDKLYWEYISGGQYLTLTQIQKYIRYINPYLLLENPCIDESIKNKIEIGVFYD